MAQSEKIELELSQRFSGVARVYGQAGLQRFASAHVCVIGLGGVGSWAVEALARSAIGTLTLIDMDHVHESNINRQLQATSDTLGQAKCVALQERIALINPDCQVHIIDEFISAENQSDLLLQGYDWVVDCIDDFRTKTLVINFCRRKKVRLITVGGAGAMIDPTRIQVADLARSKEDPLLSKVRRELRVQHGFSKDLKRRFNIPCVFSDEALRYPAEDGGITSEKPPNKGGLNCAAGFGSAVTVTATFGMAAAGHVLNKLAASVSC